MRIALAFCAALALAGCNTTVATISPQAVYVGANAFDAVEATATNYLLLPACPKAAVCRSTAAVAAIVPAIRLGRKARNAVEAYAAANPGASIPVSLSTALSAQVAALQAIFTQYGI